MGSISLEHEGAAEGVHRGVERKIYRGHEETETDLPGPLSPPGRWGLGTLALPAAMLSVASVLVLEVVALFLLHDRRYRALFVLPGSTALVVAAVAALLAWTVVLSCRSRPGRRFPRVWSLVLAVSSLLLLLAGLVEPASRWPWLHALIVANIAAVLTLLPRLVRLRIDSPWLQRIAPLTVLAVLVLILPFAWGLGHLVISSRESAIEQQLLQLRRWQHEIAALSSHDWRGLQTSPQTAAAAVQRLVSIQPGGLLVDQQLWRAAAVLGREQELAVASQELLATVVAGLQPGTAPRLSLLSEPEAHWDVAEKGWIFSSTFPKASAITGAYYQELGRLFQQLEQGQAIAEVPAMRALEQARDQLQAELHGYLTTTADTWADSWVVLEVPDHEQLLGRDQVPLVELLQRSVVEGGADRLAPGDLWSMLHQPLHSCQQLTPHAPGCVPASYQVGSYPEVRRQYHRLDCFSYRPHREQTGAELRVEVRQVYQSEPGQQLAQDALPVEVFFLFPVPASVNEREHLEAVMNALAGAVKTFWSGPVWALDTGNTAVNGFWFGENGDRVRVLQPAVINRAEHDRAVQVRAERF